MIKVTKDLDTIPECLQNNEKYDCKDVKTELRKIYNSKCCYCETKLTKNFEIEHFRPQSKYEWLQNSWSNLLLVCSSCNKSKSNRFETKNEAITSKIENIDYHKSAEYLNKVEEQLLIHPEYEDAELYLKYEKSGNIFSELEKGIYTIKLTNLNDTFLKSARYNLIEEFKKKIVNIIDDDKIETEKENFIKTSLSNNYEFAGFRRYIVKNYLDEIVNETINN